VVKKYTAATRSRPTKKEKISYNKMDILTVEKQFKIQLEISKKQSKPKI
jgi:hypothetical protein